jgi:hypothetical protein
VSRCATATVGGPCWLCGASGHGRPTRQNRWRQEGGRGDRAAGVGSLPCCASTPKGVSCLRERRDVAASKTGSPGWCGCVRATARRGGDRGVRCGAVLCREGAGFPKQGASEEDPKGSALPQSEPACGCAVRPRVRGRRGLAVFRDRGTARRRDVRANVQVVASAMRWPWVAASDVLWRAKAPRDECACVPRARARHSCWRQGQRLDGRQSGYGGSKAGQADKKNDHNERAPGY